MISYKQIALKGNNPAPTSNILSSKGKAQLFHVLLLKMHARHWQYKTGIQRYG